LGAIKRWFKGKAAPKTSPEGAAPNQGALNHLQDPAFQGKVANRAGVNCEELASDLLDASGNKGGLLTINPMEQGGSIKYPESAAPGGVAESNHHQVYTDGNFVIDPRYKGGTPIPRAEYEAEIRRLNGPNASIDFFPARP
jgi:hypothetical protein